MFSSPKFYIFTIILLKTIVSGSIVSRIDYSDDNKPIPVKTIYSNKNDFGIIHRAVDNDYGSIFDVLEYSPRNQEPKEKLNRILVKRIIPHGFISAKYEYDKKFDTFYKPLFRIHNKNNKKVHVIKNYESNENESNKLIYITNKRGNPKNKRNSMLKQISNVNEYTKKSLSQFDSKLYNNKKDYKLSNKLNNKAIDGTVKNEKLLNILNEPFKDGNNKEFLEDKTKRYELITHLAKIINNQDNRTKQYIYNKIYQIIVNRKLRQGLNGDKSGEHLIPTVKLFKEVTTQPPKVTRLPEYSFWNYWTYDKTLHQDDCPGNLIKYNNICIGGNI